MTEYTGEKQPLTLKQREIVEDLCSTHDLQPEQISFEGDELEPIFDYEAVCSLSLKLTDIAEIESSIADRQGDNNDNLLSLATCKVVLPDGRSRTVQDSAFLNETIFNGRRMDTVRKADSLAMNRAVRRGIRSVGINLYKAHKKFKETGQIATANPTIDPRAAAYREIHVLATELDLIVDGDKSAYRRFIAESFDGVESSKDLNDLDFQRLLNSLRAMARHSRTSRNKVPA